MKEAASTKHRGEAIDSKSQLTVALGISICLLLVQLVGALISHSLSLLADTVHLLGDVCALGLGVFAAHIAQRPATNARTFGFRRAEILVANLNSIILLISAIWIAVVAITRINNESQTLHTTPMLVFALIGLAGNLVALFVIRPAATHNHNARGVSLHVVSDVFGSIAVVVAAVLLRIWSTVPFDAIAAIVIALLIVPQALKLLRETLNILLEATPQNVNLDEVVSHIKDVNGVVDVHDLHAWIITSGMPVLSAHVVVDENVDRHAVLDSLNDCLRGHFDVAHCTFQIEEQAHVSHENKGELC